MQIFTQLGPMHRNLGLNAMKQAQRLPHRRLTSSSNPKPQSNPPHVANSPVSQAEFQALKQEVTTIRRHDRIDIIKTDLTKEMNLGKAELTKEIGTVRTELKETELRLHDKIGTVKAELTKEISSVKTELTKEISSVKTELTKEIGAVRTELKETELRLQDKIDTVKAELTKEIGSVKTELTKEIGSVKTELTKEIGSVKTELTKEIQGIAINLERMGTNIYRALLGAAVSGLGLIATAIYTYPEGRNHAANIVRGETPPAPNTPAVNGSK